MLQDLYQEKNQYQLFRNNLLDILRNFKQAKANIEDCDKIDSYYMVNGSNSLNNEAFKYSLSEITGIIKKIETEIIPWIDKNIKDFDIAADLESEKSTKG